MQRAGFEGDGEVIGRQPRTGVPHLEYSERPRAHGRIAMHSKPDSRCRRRDPKCVLHQIVDDLAHPRGVGVHECRVLHTGDQQLHAHLCASIPPYACGILDDQSKVEVLGSNMEVDCTHPREIEEIVD